MNSVATLPNSDLATGAVKPPNWWWACLQLSGFGFYIPLSILSGPQRGVVNTASALMVGLAVTVASVLAYVALRKRSGSPWTALAQVSIFAFFFWQWGAWEFGTTWVGWLLSAAITTTVAVAVGRVAERRLVRVGLFAISVTLLSTMAALIVQDVVNAPPATLRIPPTPELGEPANTPDVLFIVFDAYARDDILDQVYDFDNEGFLTELETAGFSIAPSANANYTMTHGSISSTLGMDYLDISDDEIVNSDLKVFQSMVSGSNPTVDLLKKAGYTYVHASADNWVNHCSGIEDVCLPGPLIDQTAFNLLAKTAVGPLLFPVSGNPTTALNRVRIDQLKDWRSFASTLGDRPRFVYMHVELPHAPLFLDSDCQPRVEPSFSGQHLNNLEMSPDLVEKRKSAYIDQLRCANETILQFIGQLEGDEIVVISSDHGPESRGFMIRDPATWSTEQIEERLRTMTALRLPTECPAASDPDLQLVNVFRVIFTCLFETPDLPVLESRYFAVNYGGPIIEFDDPDRSG